MIGDPGGHGSPGTLEVVVVVAGADSDAREIVTADTTAANTTAATIAGRHLVHHDP